METEPTNGAVGQPTQPASTAGASSSAVDVEALAQALEPTLQRLVERQWQSGKDSRIGKLTGKVDSFESQLAEYKKWIDLGKSDEEAKLFMRLTNSVSSASDPQTVPAAPAAPDGKPAVLAPSVDAETLAVLGLSGTDPDVSGLLAQGKTDLQSYIDLAKARRAKPPTQSAPATILPTGGGSSVPGEDLNTITAEINKLLAAPIKDMPKILELGKKQRALLTGK